jgi:hypothetical protein
MGYLKTDEAEVVTLAPARTDLSAPVKSAHRSHFVLPQGAGNETSITCWF